MKMDFEVSGTVFDLSVEAEKCRVITEELREMLGNEPLPKTRKTMEVYTSILLDYMFHMETKLNDLAEKGELIKKSPAPTKVQGETTTTV